MRKCAITGSSEVSNTVLNSIISLLKERVFSGTHLEIGTAAAGTLKEMILSYESHNAPKFVVIDPMTYFPNQFEIVKNNLLDAGIDPKEIVFHVSKSSAIYKEILNSGEKFDFIFLDGAHKIKQVWQDLRFTKMLNNGGVLCIDDYLGVPQVQIPVDRFLKKNTIYKKIALKNRTLFIEKTSNARNKLDFFGWLAMPFVNLFFQWRESYIKRFSKK